MSINDTDSSWVGGKDQNCQKSLGNGNICFVLTKGFPVRTIDIYMLNIIEKIFPSTFKQ